jgi:type IV fimbrial biogenesis protein FimT
MQRESRCAVSENRHATPVKFSHIGVKSNRSDASAPFVGCHHPPIGTGTRSAARADIVRAMGKRIRGFTLMELMMTLAVVGVILAITAPNFRQFLLNSRMTGAANDLLGAVQLARSEAIKRQLPVALCASADPNAEPPECAAQFGGWAVWVDADNDAVIDGGEDVIAKHDIPPASLSLTSNGSGFMSFAPSGFSQPSVGGNPATTLVLVCDERGDQLIGDTFRKRVILLSATGRPAILKRQPELAPLGAAVDCPEA